MIRHAPVIADACALAKYKDRIRVILKQMALDSGVSWLAGRGPSAARAARLIARGPIVTTTFSGRERGFRRGEEPRGTPVRRRSPAGSWSLPRGRRPLRRAGVTSRPVLSSSAVARSGITTLISFSSDEAHDAAVGDRRKHGDDLDADLRRVAEQQAVAHAVERLLREHARQHRADRAAHAMGGDDVEGIIERRLDAEHEARSSSERRPARPARWRSSVRRSRPPG